MAVYTPVSEQDIRKHLEGFDLGNMISFEGIVEGVENTNYKLVTGKGTYILTLFEKRVSTKDLPFIFSYMKHLKVKKIPCPAIVADRMGEKFSWLNGKASAITTFLDGVSVKQPEEFHAQAVGKLLAQMHLAVKDFKEERVNAMSFPAWQQLIGNCGAQPELQKELEYINTNRPPALPSGAVHADLFPDNVFFKGLHLTGVIDFYFSCTDIFAYDLMLTLNAWCFDGKGNLDARKSSAFLAAYQKLRPLSADEKKWLPYMGRAAALRIIATRLYDKTHTPKDAVVNVKDPEEYIKILKFYQSGAFKL